MKELIGVIPVKAGIQTFFWEIELNILDSCSLLTTCWDKFRRNDEEELNILK